MCVGEGGRQHRAEERGGAGLVLCTPSEAKTIRLHQATSGYIRTAAATVNGRNMKRRSRVPEVGCEHKAHNLNRSRR